MDLANTDFFANNVNTRILSITASASINLYVFRAVVTPSCGPIQYSSATELDVFIDTDNDGLRNSIDPDDDNDGVNDVDEIGNCADGTNNTDPLVVDTDGDGYNDLIDVFPCDNSEWEDCEGDGQGDNSDTDDDNDGVSDTLDPFPCDASESADFDVDGVGDNTDIDDDNDGILDVYEDTAAGDDDIDNDGIVNSKDLDSDGDGCYDVTEAGLSDPDNNGVLGNGAVAVDTQGRVNTDSISTTFTVGNNAYLSATNSASILDLDSNNTKDFLELPAINISGQPQSISVAQNTGSSFTVTATSAVTSLSFQWQYATPNFPSSWADISDSGSYSGSSSSTLSISPTLISFDGYQYRVLITNSCGAYTVTSTQATLNVEIDTDGDGDPDSTDLDDDNDGLSDAYEISAQSSTTTAVTCLDPNDPDSDDDGVIDGQDALPCDASETEDCDNDGIGNNTDTDDDNDGVLDSNDLYPCDPTQFGDTDGDGVGDGDDIDDDNDGILDVYEDTAAGDDDIDNDGIVNSKDLDSDGDGCYDVTEAGLSDPDNNGILGNGAVIVDAQGRVTTDTDNTTFTADNNAYLSATNSASILDLDSNNTKDFLELPAINISGQPQSISVAQNTGSSFTVTATSAVTSLSFQWQYATSVTATTWANLSNSGSYSGISSSTLNISPIPLSFDGYQYRVLITNSCGAFTVTSTQATLTVEIDTDGDGDPDSTDLDDDNDGLSDAFEISAQSSTTTAVTCLDPNDPDSDNDGIIDGQDALPCDASETEDCDNDGIGNNTDTDDDNDGVLDVADLYPCDPTQFADTDLDGIGDGDDIDDDNDGILDVYEDTATGDNDIDNDGIVNSKDLDSDGDGCFDVTEAGLSDPDGDGILGNGFNLTDSSAYNFINGSYANEYAGQGNTGDFAPYNIGQGVDISADGNIVIYGAREYDGPPGNSNSGHAAVYQRTNTGAASWTLIGDFYGDSNDDYFGQSVSINGRGDIVAIGAHYDEPSGGTNRGAVYVYKYNSATASWSLLGGAPLTGSGNSDYFGTSLSLNHKGDRIAIGVPYDDDSGSNRGSVIVYQYNSGTESWDNIGQVVGKQNSGYFGFGVKMNKAGDRFVASAPYDDQIGTDRGTMRVYQYGGGTTWNQVGADMGGYSTYDYYGTVAINAAGDRVAFSDGTRNNQRIFIYGESGGTWSQLGNNYSGSSSIYQSATYFGASIDFNESGNLLGVGQMDRVYFYEYNGSTWSQKGSYLDKNYEFWKISSIICLWEYLCSSDANI